MESEKDSFGKWEGLPKKMGGSDSKHEMSESKQEGPIQKHDRSDSKKEGLVSTSQPQYKRLDMTV